MGRFERSFWYARRTIAYPRSGASGIGAESQHRDGDRADRRGAPCRVSDTIVCGVTFADERPIVWTLIQ